MEKHGEHIITIKDNIIHVTLKGAFNEQGAKEVSKIIKDVVLTFGQKKFVKLVNLLDLEGATPEAFDKFNEFNEWLNSKNMIAKAMVITSQTMIAIEQKWLPAKASQNIEYFENESTALAWLKKQL